MEKQILTIEEMSTFCKRKGFVYPSSEIYGGLAGLYDYGHLGTLLKKNFEDMWREYFLSLDDNFFEIEASEIMHESTFVASGHLKNFVDLAAKCQKGHAEVGLTDAEIDDVCPARSERWRGRAPRR